MILSLIIALLFIAIAYSSVGHGGASGYVAVLVLYGYLPDQLRPLVLTMNIIVTSCLMFRYLLKSSASDFDWAFILRIIAISMPAAFYGGGVNVDEQVLKKILGILLLISALRLFINTSPLDNNRPSLFAIVIVGLSIGFVSGLTGIGGGILLSPILVFLGWFTVKQSLPIVSLFILFNSIAGLAGWLFAGNPWQTLPLDTTLSFYTVAFVGALLGGMWSTQYASHKAIRFMLASVLLVAGGKMLIT